MKKGLTQILCFMKALQWNLLSSHWQANGTSYYGDHLLFMRLYENMDDRIDKLAEKIVGYFDENAVEPLSLFTLTFKYLKPFCEIEDLFERAIAMEEEFQELLEDVYDSIEEMPMGIDDFIMGLAEQHEEHIYLLGQRLR